jgi:hypothetical protein
VGSSRGKRDWANQVVVGLHTGKENKEKRMEEVGQLRIGPMKVLNILKAFLFPVLIQIQI